MAAKASVERRAAHREPRADAAWQMKRRAAVICLALVALHGVLLGLVTFTAIFRNSPLEAFGITALLLPYFLQHLGLPVLEHSGLDGAGWAAPNLLGWLLSAVAWLAFYGLIALAIAWVSVHAGRRAHREAGRE